MSVCLKTHTNIHTLTGVSLSCSSTPWEMEEEGMFLNGNISSTQEKKSGSVGVVCGQITSLSVLGISFLRMLPELAFSGITPDVCKLHWIWLKLHGSSIYATVQLYSHAAVTNFCSPVYMSAVSLFLFLLLSPFCLQPEIKGAAEERWVKLQDPKKHNQSYMWCEIR